MSQINIRNLSNENDDGSPEIVGVSTFSATSFFVPPKGTLQSPWAIGNTSSCDAAGIMMYAGNLAYPLYIFAISIYFYCRVTKLMTEDEFRNKVERKIHYLILTFVATTSLAALFTGSINTIPTGSLCAM